MLIENRSYVKVIGFELRNNLGVSDGSGVRVLGISSHIEIRDNRIHDIRGQDAMGITVYGTAATAISDLIIDGNEIYECDPYRSEALTLNGNVTDFAVTNNLVRDVNNIGIDFIAGETDIQPDPTKVARNGVCRDNVVLRANEQGGGFAAGIYVDGGRDIVIERNVVSGSDLGIEIGAENPGTVTTGIVVRDNVLHANDKVGLVFGGFSAGVGRVRDSTFLNNTLWHNDTQGVGFGELWIQFAEDNVVRNNLVVAAAQNLLVFSEAGNVNNTLDHNLFFASAGAAGVQFVWQGTAYGCFAAYRAGSGQDAMSLFADPLLVDSAGGDFHLRAGSPAVDAGDPAFVAASGETDMDGAPCVSGTRVDIGADELTCGNPVLEAGEACDDGGTAGGDCCSGACQFEAGGSICDDAAACTNADACDGAGACVASAAPLPLCAGAASGQASLVLKDADNDGGDTLVWKLRKGGATSSAALGDPRATDHYTLCLYDAAALP